MIARSIRFPETYLIDATYGTNNLKMPLICVYGVSNVGLKSLKTFPVAFAWVSSEKEEIYSWFLQTLQINLNGISEDTVFVTDKCTALMNQLDKQFPETKKMLCRWHLLNNLDKNCTLSLFKKEHHGIKEEFKSFVKKIMYSPEYKDYVENVRKIRSILENKNLFVCEEERIRFKKYYENEWILHLEKWAALYTSKLQHMDCTTTQRAESGHSALKKGMISLQSLDRTFDSINEYLEAVERE